MNNSLLIIDDEPNMLHMLSNLLGKKGYHISTAGDGEEGLAIIKESTFDFILCDIRMPQMDGLAFLQAAGDYLKSSTVIMMSAYGTVDVAIECLKKGAYDFISKPFKTDEVFLTLRKAEERLALQKENKRLKTIIQLIQDQQGVSNMIGNSRPMKELFRLIQKVASYDTSVLITGESGTGKELIAKGIHEKSNRVKNKLVAVNCGSIPLSLMESEFFGHKRGAFTGADRDKKGLFEEANNGTLFLDEIGELPMELQVKLLRVLQEQEFRPVGSTVTKKIDVRVLAATAKDLNSEVAHGRFRQDLLFRLNVVEMVVPPLRERKNDIPALASHFLAKHTEKMKIEINSIDKTALTKLTQYDWPGNVRELENVIEHAIIYAEGKTILPNDLPEKIKRKGAGHVDESFMPDSFSIKEGKIHFEKALIKKALAKTSGNKSKAAILLEISYPSLLNKIQQYNI